MTRARLRHQAAIEALVKGFNAKTPKAAAAAVDAALRAVGAFGLAVVKPGPVLKARAALLYDSRIDQLYSAMKRGRITAFYRQRRRCSRTEMRSCATRQRTWRWS